jgi:hypothetical protein
MVTPSGWSLIADRPVFEFLRGDPRFQDRQTFYVVLAYDNAAPTCCRTKTSVGVRGAPMHAFP